MSSVGIERGVSGLPVVPPEYIEEIMWLPTYATVTGGSGNTPATGTFVCASNPFAADGQTVYELRLCCQAFYGATQPQVAIYENATYLGSIWQVDSGLAHQMQRTLRRVPPAGTIIYTAVVWAPTSSAPVVQGDAAMPIEMVVRRVKRLP